MARNINGYRQRMRKTTKKQESVVMMQESIAVIDTETTYYDDVMSIGVVIADGNSLEKLHSVYYVFPEECCKPAMYSNVLYMKGQEVIEKCREDAICDILALFEEYNVKSIFAYNALFDLGHLPELSGFTWKDIMRLAAYRQFNPYIPEDIECYKTGRLKSGYGVESIMRMIHGDRNYSEVHNALCDAEDELKIMQMLGHRIKEYPRV